MDRYAAEKEREKKVEEMKLGQLFRTEAKKDRVSSLIYWWFPSGPRA